MIKAPLSVRIVLLVLVTSGILVGGMLATVYQLMVSDYEALVAERETAVIKRVASELELSNQKRLLGLEAFATRLVTDDGQLLDDDALQSLLQKSSVASELFPDGLLVLDAEATAVAEDQYSPGRLGTNYADRPHFQLARQTQQAVISEPILGRTTGLPLLSYLQPIVAESGDLIGYAGGLLNLANTPLVDTGSVIESDPSTVTLIIDPQHRLFVSMQERFDRPEPLPDEGADALVDAALSLSPAGSIVEYQQESYLVASRQLDSPGWIILRALPYSEAIAPAQASFRHFLLIALIAMTIVGLAGAWIARSLTQPIERITRRIEHMADNARFDSDFQEKGGPEVTALAHAMNRLANERKAADMAIYKAERFLSSVLESASEVSIIATDTTGIITAFNKGAENMLGYSHQEMVGKQTPAILHLKEEVDARSAQLTTELGHSVEGFRVFVEKAEQRGSEKREWIYVHKDGHQIPVSMVVTVMRDSAGEINGYVGIAENITDRKRADKIKNEFISTVNHELRTPLTSISGALGLMVGGNVGELPEKAQTLLTTAHRNSKRLTHLINDLLDIEKIAEGKLHFDMQVHAVMPLLEQALEANQHYGSNRGITLSLAGNASNALINVDNQRFMQIMANLLSNAIKFSPQGGEVTLAVETTSNKVSISVIDSGPGIANAFRKQIFQRFAQADASDSRAKEGTGLGLAITRELVEHMGGRIDFESTEGNGSRFFFELPLVQAAEQDTWQLEGITDHQEAPRILVVEDDKDVAKLLSIMLNDAGYQVDTASTGAEALNRLKQTHYDLISLDLMLPDTDGLDIIRLLRQQPDTADIPIVVVSAKMEQGRLAINGDATNIDWLAKPIDQKQLIGIVQQQLSDKYKHHSRVLHIEDDHDLHEVVCAMAGDHFSFEAAYTVQEALTRLKQGAFDVVLLDIGLPDGSGWELVADIRACQPGAKLVILSGADMTQQQHGQVEAVLLKSRLSKETLINGINARIQSFRSTRQPPTNPAS
ncbi:response regulator [Vreelandella neptunia]|uniref:histidine kinase n=1 Tax=Vreelandella neptunia TaxID=115551 RepID=A0ABZ0YLZ9_9GAMM|nr:response regulator [Halomonas neptunia]MDN3560825.1 response regulator [Halomonas neptunia]TDV97457.1 PAS domain S-box-containing protein [Halomonas alkaliantarctica]WQH13137.1 response regulator [Halomonas neptunia]